MSIVMGWNLALKSAVIIPLKSMTMQAYLLSNGKEGRVEELRRAIDADQRRRRALVDTTSSTSSGIVERSLCLVHCWIELSVSVETVRALCIVPESPLGSLVATCILAGSGHYSNDGSCPLCGGWIVGHCRRNCSRRSVLRNSLCVDCSRLG